MKFLYIKISRCHYRRKAVICLLDQLCRQGENRNLLWQGFQKLGYFVLLIRACIWLRNFIYSKNSERESFARYCIKCSALNFGLLPEFMLDIGEFVNLFCLN